ncbi:hypothetical protein QA601_16895, partial [Chitinispirillales bacterium ANBcel5]|uniref:hypothetical protein n=1 Tax=Cellulosispirillum alkaliphilum TaxID=3039283 RepID=UPI002A54B789|nr:hypothetical protein [Chitinispirillales bacterium ANBcel5]
QIYIHSDINFLKNQRLEVPEHFFADDFSDHSVARICRFRATLVPFFTLLSYFYYLSVTTTLF